MFVTTLMGGNYNVFDNPEGREDCKLRWFWRPRGAGSGEYLGLVLDVLRWRGVIDMICNKSTIAHLTAEKLAALRVPWPPVSRQFKIAQEVRALRNDVSLLSERAQDAVGLLRERRQALISAAVTGQIDVGRAS